MVGQAYRSQDTARAGSVLLGQEELLKQHGAQSQAQRQGPGGRLR